MKRGDFDEKENTAAVKFIVMYAGLDGLRWQQ